MEICILKSYFMYKNKYRRGYFENWEASYEHLAMLLICIFYTVSKAGG